MSTARLSEFTAYGIDCKAIVADYGACNVEYINNTLSGVGKFGINGTFYGSNGDLYGIVCTTGGKPVQTYSGSNAGYKRGTLIVSDSPSSSDLIAMVSQIYNIDEAPISKSAIKFAIGGMSLHLDKSYSSAQAFFNEVTVDPEHADAVGFDDLNFRCYHTAIGYRTSDKKIIMLVTGPSNVWELRTILKDYIVCNDAIYLDSNPSSQLRAKNSSGSVISYGYNNNVRNYVTVNPTTWL